MKAGIFSSTASRPTHVRIPKPKLNLARNLGTIWQGIANGLIGNSEPKIWKLADAQGNTYWRIYDPVVRQFLVLDTEHDVRIWIEQRYSKSN